MFILHLSFQEIGLRSATDKDSFSFSSHENSQVSRNCVTSEIPTFCIWRGSGERERDSATEFRLYFTMMKGTENEVAFMYIGTILLFIRISEI